jgi:hypothetical protein
MSTFHSVLERIRKNKKIKESGGYVGIPLPFPRLRSYLAAIEKGHSIGVLGPTGSGKSRFVRYLFIYYVYEFAKKTGYNVRVFYFPLEDNKEKVYTNIICHWLWKEKRIRLSVQDIDSKRDKPLSDEVLSAIEEAEAFFIDFDKHITIIDHLTEPLDIFQELRTHAEKNGTIQYMITKDTEGKDRKIPVKYIPKDDLHTIALVDNLSNFDSETSQDERQKMIRFARTYSRKWLCNFFRFTVVQVMQMSFDKERPQFTAAGTTIVSKLEPSLDGIGEAKVIARSMHIILGLFDPSRHDILSYPNGKGYDIHKLGNKFRAVKVLKCNDSEPGLRIGVYIDAVPEVFEELPLPDDPAMERIYRTLAEQEKTGKISSSGSLFG